MPDETQQPQDQEPQDAQGELTDAELTRVDGAGSFVTRQPEAVPIEATILPGIGNVINRQGA